MPKRQASSRDGFSETLSNPARCGLPPSIGGPGEIVSVAGLALAGATALPPDEVFRRLTALPGERMLLAPAVRSRKGTYLDVFTAAARAKAAGERQRRGAGARFPAAGAPPGGGRDDESLWQG